MEISRQHLPRDDHQRVPQHVPPLRPARADAPLQRALQRRGPGPVDRGRDQEDPPRGREVCGSDPGGDRRVEEEDQRAERYQFVPDDEEYVHGGQLAGQGV